MPRTKGLAIGNGRLGVVGACRLCFFLSLSLALLLSLRVRVSGGGAGADESDESEYDSMRPPPAPASRADIKLGNGAIPPRDVGANAGLEGNDVPGEGGGSSNDDVSRDAPSAIGFRPKNGMGVGADVSSSKLVEAAVELGMTSVS